MVFQLNIIHEDRAALCHHSNPNRVFKGLVLSSGVVRNGVSGKLLAPS